MKYILVILLLINTAYGQEWKYVKKANVSQKIRGAVLNKDFKGYVAGEWQIKTVGLNTYYKGTAPLKTNKDEKITFIYVYWTNPKTRKLQYYLKEWNSSIELKKRLKDPKKK